MLALERQKWEDLCEFKVDLVYLVSYSKVRTT